MMQDSMLGTSLGDFSTELWLMLRCVYADIDSNQEDDINKLLSEPINWKLLVR